MKKLFFSAMALVAFSSVSMASTIAENERTDITNSMEEVVVKKDYWDCALIANTVYQELLLNFSEEEAMQNADAYFTDCMGELEEPCRPPFLC